MDIQEALKHAQMFKKAISNDNYWDLQWNGGGVYKEGLVVGISPDSSKQFMLLLLNTFLDMHDSLSKSLEGERKELQDAYNKYGEPFVHALQKSAEEHSHNFVQQWLDQHDDDKDNHLIDFGPTNQEPETDNPEDSEEDIPQIVINIGKLNINFPAIVEKLKKEFSGGKPSEEEESEQSTHKGYLVILEDAGPAFLKVVKTIRDACGLGLGEAKDLVDGAPHIIAVDLPLRRAEILKRAIETQGGVASIKEIHECKQ